MCGIVGVVGGPEAGEEEKKRALDALSHRGPDGWGQWRSGSGRAWLGHRRLSIIDPEGGKQPCCNEDGTVWITFNGCVYNYLELSQWLRKKGHKFRTHSDTEVIVHCYEEYGEKCVDHLIGMFAFAIWDEKAKRLFCARDRVGVKPFYYYFRPGLLAFASEIKGLLAFDFVRTGPDRNALNEYLIFQTTIGENTLFEGIKKLLPGCCLAVDEDMKTARVRQYWDLDFQMDTDHSEAYFTDRLRFLLEDAVKIRLRSDVPLGAHLSGGLDSSTVVALASMLHAEPDRLKTFTGAFEEGEQFNETGYARLAAGRTGVANYETYPTAMDFVENLPRLIHFMDEPAAGPGLFPQFMVSRLASQHVKVVLGGQGGDEIFAGYARYVLGYLEECLRGAIFRTGDSSHYVTTLQTIAPNLAILDKYVPMLKHFWRDGLFDSQEHRYFRLMDRSLGAREIYHEELFSNEKASFEKYRDIFFGSNAKSFLNRMLFFDLKVHLPALLHVEDRTSMAWGLESRVPLLDHRIIEFMAAIPPVIKFKGAEPKYLFRKAVANIVPQEILDRKDKMGFPVPLHLWYQGKLKNFISDVLLDPGARKRSIFKMDRLEKAVQNEKEFGRTVWGALCLELWFRNFFD